MPKAKRKWDILSEEQRKKTIDDIISFFQTERDEEIGIIAAENILDFFLQNTGAQIYNKGLEDAKDFVKERLEGTLLDIEASLKKDQR